MDLTVGTCFTSALARYRDALGVGLRNDVVAKCALNGVHFDTDNLDATARGS